MSSRHDDYVTFHNTVNAQNRSNYEIKYRLIERIPLAIIGVSSLYNVFSAENWNLWIGIITLVAIVYSLSTYVLLYELLECSNSMNTQWLEIASKNQNLPLDQQIMSDPKDKEKYERLNRWMGHSYKTSIFICVILIFSIGGNFMSNKRTKSESPKVVTTQERNDRGVVTRPLIQEQVINNDGKTTGPILPEAVVAPDTTPPTQPTAQPAGQPVESPTAEIKAPEAKPPPADKSGE